MKEKDAMTQAQVICHALYVVAGQYATDAKAMRAQGYERLAQQFERQEFEARIVLGVIENGQPLDLEAEPHQGKRI